MAANEEKETRNLLAKELSKDLQHHSVIRAFPAAGMSHLNLIGLLRLLENEKEREWPNSWTSS
jgi:hypothetical protein